ncbi:hypothetical protein G9A89_013028 [Geosiphon pyriformis]|nr:hypothetical protein G9A89_013028 [Geosiphon pyriformis]
MDPFQARLDFLRFLKKMSHYQATQKDACAFAICHRVHCEDLFSCINESLEEAKVIHRLNYLNLYDYMTEASLWKKFTGYTDLIRQNLAGIVANIVPEGAEGRLNIANTRKVLSIWREKGYHPDAVIDAAEQVLREREQSSPPVTATTFRKEEILKRMEYDREQHKRIREHMWLRPPPQQGINSEFEEAWANISENDEINYDELMTDNYRYIPSYPWHEMLEEAQYALQLDSDTPETL